MQKEQPAPYQVELDLVDGSESDEEERDRVEPGARRSDRDRNKLNSLYMSGGEDPFYIGVYVDDMVLAGCKTRIGKVKKEVASKFDIKDLGELSYFLGISVVRNQETWMGQPEYTEKLLSKMGMSDCKPVKTPVDASSHLVKATEEEEAVDQQLYQSVVGSLMYMATCTVLPA